MTARDAECLQEYESFWKKIVETDGQIDKVKVARELHDYRRMLQSVPVVYKPVTGGRLSNPNSPADWVIEVADEWAAQRAEWSKIEGQALSDPEEGTT